MNKVNERALNKMLKHNGYVYVRNNGHKIYTNGKRTISIPRSMNGVIIRRLIKENNLKEC